MFQAANTLKGLQNANPNSEWKNRTLMAAEHGANVVVNDIGASLSGASESTDAAAAVVNEITAAGGQAMTSRANVADAKATQAMVDEAIAKFGRLDAVINNAGILRDGFFHKMTAEDFEAVIRVHLMGSFNVSRAAAEQFRTHVFT